MSEIEITCTECFVPLVMSIDELKDKKRFRCPVCNSFVRTAKGYERKKIDDESLDDIMSATSPEEAFEKIQEAKKDYAKRRFTPEDTTLLFQKQKEVARLYGITVEKMIEMKDSGEWATFVNRENSKRNFQDRKAHRHVLRQELMEETNGVCPICERQVTPLAWNLDTRCCRECSGKSASGIDNRRRALKKLFLQMRNWTCPFCEEFYSKSLSDFIEIDGMASCQHCYPRIRRYRQRVADNRWLEMRAKFTLLPSADTIDLKEIREKQREQLLKEQNRRTKSEF